MARMSQAFAAFRTSILAELQDALQKDLVPHFNAEIEDIRKDYETTVGDKGEALADYKKRQRILDLKVRQKAFIDGLNEDLVETLTKRIQSEPYNGVITPVVKDEKTVLQVVFADKSVAHVPSRMWIDYTQFQGV